MSYAQITNWLDKNQVKNTKVIKKTRFMLYTFQRKLRSYVMSLTLFFWFVKNAIRPFLDWCTNILLQYLYICRNNVVVTLVKMYHIHNISITTHRPCNLLIQNNVLNLKNCKLKLFVICLQSIWKFNISEGEMIKEHAKFSI